jgi:hypothetical protein
MTTLPSGNTIAILTPIRACSRVGFLFITVARLWRGALMFGFTAFASHRDTRPLASTATTSKGQCEPRVRATWRPCFAR